MHQRISDLRHDILHIRQTLSPTRDAVHRVVDGRVEGEAPRLLDAHEITLFSDVYDKLLRANDALELSRDLVAGVRDFYQSKVAQSQNEVVQRLDGDRLHPPLPHVRRRRLRAELRSHAGAALAYGYAFSWAVIVVATIGQVAYFRRKKWI